MTTADVVSVRDLRNRGGQVLDDVARGHSVTVTRDGEPIARLTPIPRRRLSVDELIARRRALPAMDSAALREDLDELLDQTW